MVNPLTPGDMILQWQHLLPVTQYEVKAVYKVSMLGDCVRSWWPGPEQVKSPKHYTCVLIIPKC